MPDISPSIPIVGQPNSTEESKIVTALTQLVATVNDLDTANFADSAVTAAKIADGAATDAKLASPNNGVWKTLRTADATINAGNGTVAAGVTYYVTMLSRVVNQTVGTSAGISHVYIDGSTLAVAGKSLRLRLQASILTNSIAPGVNLTFGFGRAGSLSGSSDLTTMLVAGTAAAVMNTPGAGQGTTAVSAEVALPANDYYVFYVQSSGTPAAGYSISASLALQYRFV